MRPNPCTVFRLLSALLVLAPSAAMGALPKKPVALQATYRGTMVAEAHYRRPGETRTYTSEQRFYTDGKRVRLDWQTAESDTEAWSPESFLVDGDRVFKRSAPGGRWRLLTGWDAHQNRAQALAGLPERYRKWLGRTASTTPARGRKGVRIERYTSAWAHPRLGDVRDSTVYFWGGGDVAPRELRMVQYERDHNWWLSERLVSWSNQTPPDSLFAAPADFDTPASAPDSLVEEPKIVPVAPGIWMADMEDIDSRSLIVEFADHLALLEMAVGSANGERLVDAAKKRWPEKPFRYAFFSHFHPHYAGGVRALMAEGATIVTTSGNGAFIRSRADLPFTLRPDRLARAPRPVKVQTFADRFELQDSANQLLALNYGDRSQHTDEFVVFWLPRQKVLFEAELGWVRTGERLRAIRRAPTLLAWLDEQKLGVDRFVQSWPMRENSPSLSRAELDSLVRIAKK